MSFLKTLEHDLIVVGKDMLAIAPVVGAVVSVFNQPLGAAIIGISGRITSLIVAAETVKTDPGAGPERSQMVIASLDQILADVTMVTGDKYTYDKAALQGAIDAEVAALNLKGVFKQTLKKQ